MVWVWGFDLWEWVLGRGGVAVAWGCGCGWVLINQRSLFASKPKQSKKHIQNLKIFQQWQRLTAFYDKPIQKIPHSKLSFRTCVLGCGGCGGCVVVVVSCWQQCGGC